MGFDPGSLSALVVFLLFVVVSVLVTYHKLFCTCVSKEQDGFFIDSHDSDVAVYGRSDNHNEGRQLRQVSCCCCICLINRKIDMVKYVYVHEGFKGDYRYVSYLFPLLQLVSTWKSWLSFLVSPDPLLVEIALV